MSTTICLYISCSDWEFPKEHVLKSLSEAKKFLKKLGDVTDVKVMKDGKSTYPEMYYSHFDSFVKTIDEKSHNDEDNIIAFSDLDGFTKQENDIELGELDFQESLSLNVAYGTTVGCIGFQMSVDMSSTEAVELIVSDVLNYENLPMDGDGINAEMNDTDGNYIEDALATTD
jgi:hypothetical protein